MLISLSISSRATVKLICQVIEPLRVAPLKLLKPTMPAGYTATRAPEEKQ
jgi:hypothetical protein